MGGCFSCCKGEKDYDSMEQFKGVKRDKEAILKKMEYIKAENETHTAHIVLDQNDLEQRMMEAGNKLVVVDFFTVWCGTCKVIEPEFEKLAKENKDEVVFLKVDADFMEDLANEHVEGLPTIVGFRNGQLVGKSSPKVWGHTTPEKLRDFIEQLKSK